ncbi:MAG: ABC transporter permease [Burkholderiales bacterium]|nr:ABC transporter permease [Burkholderiales bacterium]
MSLIKNLSSISIARIIGLIQKEFTLISRDRGTIAMLVILPIMLLIVFGFAISLDPKNLPTTIVNYDQTPLTRSFIASLQSSGYYNLVNSSDNEVQAMSDLDSGKTSFVITIPANFTHDYIRGKNPQLLVELDASDPGSSASALSNIQPILSQTLSDFSQRGLITPSVAERSANLIVHRNYNESNRSDYNIVPGLIGVLLTLTMVMLTSTAITSETESGTMEMLLTTPLLATEIILGKIIPYIVLGYLQLTSILIFGKLLINIPIEGSVWLLYLAAAPFIIANLMVGMILSTIAKTPMQAMQLSVFFQLPSMFLTGYVFSFYGMPQWAQMIGQVLPMTYFTRITRGIMLKGNGFGEIVPNVWPILLIATVLVVITSIKFKKTLD